MVVKQNGQESEGVGNKGEREVEHTSAYLGGVFGADCPIVAFCNGSTNSPTAAAGVARFEEDSDDGPGVIRSDKDNLGGVLLEEVDIFWLRIDNFAGFDLLLGDSRGTWASWWWKSSRIIVGRCDRFLGICHCGRVSFDEQRS